jgi:hypothetical protein
MSNVVVKGTKARGRTAEGGEASFMRFEGRAFCQDKTFPTFDVFSTGLVRSSAPFASLTALTKQTTVFGTQPRVSPPSPKGILTPLWRHDSISSQGGKGVKKELGFIF